LIQIGFNNGIRAISSSRIFGRKEKSEEQTLAIPRSHSMKSRIKKEKKGTKKLTGEGLVARRQSCAAVSGRAVPLNPVRIGMPRHMTKNMAVEKHASAMAERIEPFQG
jgi:hypothetical protein